MRFVVCVVLAAGCRLNFDGVPDPRTVRATVIGPGAIVSDPPGLACIDSCEAEFLGAVTLTVTPGGPLGISAWTGAGADCTGTSCVLEGSEDQDITVELAAEAAPTTNRVFVTSSAFPAALKQATDADGLAAGDRLCTQTAAAAGLAGTFVAFLSSDTLGIDAVDRLGSALGWVRTDGAPVYADRAAITSRDQLYAIDRDEAARKIAASSWLGGGQHGMRMPGFGDCQGYTATAAGENIYTFPQHSVANDYATTCMFLEHLLCFQTDNQVPIVPPKAFPLGRYAFVSDKPWDLATGFAGADAQCAQDARGAQLEGQFVAALATKTSSVSDRVGTLKGVWRRADGIVLSLTALGDSLAAPLHRTASGKIENTPAFIGAPSLESVATENCDDWKDVTTPNRKGVAAWAFQTENWIQELGIECTSGHLLCLELKR